MCICHCIAVLVITGVNSDTLAQEEISVFSSLSFLHFHSILVKQISNSESLFWQLHPLSDFRRLYISGIIFLT